MRLYPGKGEGCHAATDRAEGGSSQRRFHHVYTVYAPKPSQTGMSPKVCRMLKLLVAESCGHGRARSKGRRCSCGRRAEREAEFQQRASVTEAGLARDERIRVVIMSCSTDILAPYTALKPARGQAMAPATELPSRHWQLLQLCRL